MADDSSIMYECQDNGEAPPTKTTCPLGCDKNGEQCADTDQKVRCKEDLTGITSSTGTTDTECKYCYNADIGNDFTSIEKLGCAGCVPNEYKPKESIGSTLDPMDEVCYNGKLEQFGDAKGSDFILSPQSDSNGLWEFALNVTPAPSIAHPKNPPQQTWRYYNCHNDDAMNSLTKHTKVNNVSDFLDLLKRSNKCCDDENSYYITRTGYRYYSVEKCTNIALHDIKQEKNTATEFSAYAYTTELNDFLIGTKHDLLDKDYACLEVRDKTEDTKAVRRMFIKQKTNGEQQSKDGEPKHGIYKVFECPENYECDLKNPYNGLCIYHEIDDIDKTIEECDGKFKCNTNNTIFCNIDSNNGMIVAKCPEGTTLRIVGDNDVKSKCDDQSNLTLDKIQCVPVSKSTPEQ